MAMASSFSFACDGLCSTTSFSSTSATFRSYHNALALINHTFSHNYSHLFLKNPHFSPFHSSTPAKGADAPGVQNLPKRLQLTTTKSSSECLGSSIKMSKHKGEGIVKSGQIWTPRKVGVFKQQLTSTNCTIPL